MKLGVISDTHGLLRPLALAALRGCDHLVHAGDVGPEQILQTLATLAPLTTVLGNIDRAPWTESLPATATLQIGGVWVHVLHNIGDLDLDLHAAAVRVVISGHSHKPSIREDGGVLFLNPGSAGPRRFKLPVTVATLEIDAAGYVTPSLVELGV